MDGQQGPDASAGGRFTCTCRTRDGPEVAALSGTWLSERCALIAEIRALEDQKSALAARQARSVAFDLPSAVNRHSRDASGRARGGSGAQIALGRGAGPAVCRLRFAQRPSTRRAGRRGVGAQIALARRESPAKGGRLLGLAKALVTEMPHTLAALEAGQLNEWHATLLVRETAGLSAEDRAAVDAELAADTGTFDGAGDRRIIAAARAAAYRRDPRTVTQRASHAATERHVSLRPAPDTMCYFTALLPVSAGVADARRPHPARRHPPQRRGPPHPRPAHDRHPRRTHHRHPRRDHRHRDPARHDRPHPPPGRQRTRPPPRLRHRPRRLGPGPPRRCRTNHRSPAQNRQPNGNRQGATGTAGTEPGTHTGSDTDQHPDLHVWLRRLYTAPGTGELTAMDSRARLFPPGLRRFIQARDDTCRTPYCDAPIRHFDHIIPWHRGGPTTHANGAGLCEACNHTKETPGWNVRPRPGPQTHPRDHDPHRPHLPLHRTPTARARIPRWPFAPNRPGSATASAASSVHHLKTVKRARLEQSPCSLNPRGSEAWPHCGAWTPVPLHAPRRSVRTHSRRSGCRLRTLLPGSPVRRCLLCRVVKILRRQERLQAHVHGAR